MTNETNFLYRNTLSDFLNAKHRTRRIINNVQSKQRSNRQLIDEHKMQHEYIGQNKMELE